MLDKAPPASFTSGATALGAALTVLAAQPQSDSATPSTADMAIGNAAPAAYGVLDRARAAGGCAPQLDLLLLLTADESTSAGILGQEERRAEAACPHDPTPAWLVGQSQLRFLLFSEPSTTAGSSAGALQAATATFSHLAAEYRRDAGVLTGLGDSYLRTGTFLRSSEPFTARQAFLSAITMYNRASALGDGHAALALANWPVQFLSVRPGGGYCAQTDKLKLMAETEAGQKPDQNIMKSDSITSDDIADGWQNLLRWAGNLSAAKEFAEQWQAARRDNSALPALRLGEIDFLMHQYNDAAAEFGLAARRWRLVSYNDDLDVDQAELDRGAALLAAGRTAEATQTLRPRSICWERRATLSRIRRVPTRIQGSRSRLSPITRASSSRITKANQATCTPR